MCEVFWYPRCLDNICLTENTKFDYNISKRLDLSYEDIHFNKFKINEHRKGRYPKLYASQSLQIDNKRIFVILIEAYEWHERIFYIELDSEGHIIN